MLTSSPFKKQLDVSLKEKQRITVNLTAGGTRTKKSILQNAIETVNSLKVLLAYTWHTTVALLSHTWDRSGRLTHLN
jgi:hypothetical protein